MFLVKGTGWYGAFRDSERPHIFDNGVYTFNLCCLPNRSLKIKRSKSATTGFALT